MALSDLARAYVLEAKAKKIAVTMWPWSTAVGCLIAGRGFPPILPTVLATLAMTAISACAYFYNDVVDWEMDSLHPIKKNRPIPSGKVSVNDVMKIVYINGAIGIALSLFLNLNALIFAMLWMALYLAYSYPRIRLKNIFPLKEGVSTFGFFLTTLMGGAAVGSISITVIFSGIIFFIYVFMMAPTFLDTIDIEVDKKFGVRTLAIVLNWKTKIEMAIAFLLVIMTLTPLTYVQLGLNTIFPILVVAACLLFLRYLFPLLNSFEQKLCDRAFHAGVCAWILTQMALIIGSINFA